MTKILTALGLTRDSALFLWTKIAGVSGLVVTGVIDPRELGLTDKQAHVLMIACGAVAYLSGQLSTSSLPGATAAVAQQEAQS
jgi:hypothetical protein